MGRYLDNPVFSGQIVFTTGSFKPGAGVVIDLSLSTLTLPTNCLTAAMLPAMVGDTGLGGAKGAVPAPPAGAGAGGMFLNAYGQWTVPTVGLPAGTALALNPMTTAGDMIVGGANGATTRLPAGAVGLFLSMGANGPTWVAAPSGGGGGEGESSTLAGLSDVDETTAPSNGQALVFNTAEGKWKPGTVAGGSSGGAGATGGTAGVPDLSQWTLAQATNGAATAEGSVSGGKTQAVSVTVPCVAGNCALIHKPAPAAPYRIVAKFDGIVATGYSDTFGIGYYDPSSGKRITFGSIGNGFVLWKANGGSLAGNVSSDGYQNFGNPYQYWPGQNFYYALYNDGTNINYQWSVDGVNWDTVFSETIEAGYLSASGFSHTCFSVTPNPLGGFPFGRTAWTCSLTHWDESGLTRDLSSIGTPAGSSGGPFNFSPGVPDFAAFAKADPNNLGTYGQVSGQVVNIRQTGANPGSVNLFGIFKPASAGTPYILSVYCLYAYSASNYNGPVWGWHDPVSGKFDFCRMGFEGGGATSRLEYMQFSDPNTRAGLASIGSTPLLNPAMWLHLFNDGTTLKWGWSVDGFTIQWIESQTLASSYMGAGNYTNLFLGIFPDGETGGQFQNVLGLSILCWDENGLNRTFASLV